MVNVPFLYGFELLLSGAGQQRKHYTDIDCCLQKLDTYVFAYAIFSLSFSEQFETKEYFLFNYKRKLVAVVFFFQLKKFICMKNSYIDYRMCLLHELWLFLATNC